MKHSEQFALNQWLSCYPDDMSYEDILDCMNDPKNTWSSDNISVWQTVENFPMDQVAEFIEDTKNAFEIAVRHMQNEHPAPVMGEYCLSDERAKP